MFSSTSPSTRTYVAVDFHPPMRIGFDWFAYAETGLNEPRFTHKACVTGRRQTLGHIHNSHRLTYLCVWPNWVNPGQSFALIALQDPTAGTTSVFQHAEKADNVVMKFEWTM